ncbi:tRNA (guanosine(46)-N7)-methyltransferase TrmB [Furfurilactobacillus siliginis]|uniref:tRNA (guanine-N(7)-)-methyltransferase n=1 Tax=Furfurilactobacillus siliginis TaxID=348151 RepID=A0A0R2L6H2_9LACO|nr:tRNA (guanosine(46)-N7)-methyltransferase TrmB [Furfurilactobacillus siliginis]KRN94509.1 tRNA (guanine-N(7)-)-methyltransferase [Furfurilactobacillus siliginis]GEK28550.1 tRNA (guanine-N(7)-)-methyltransferase [Furfurilactobacillus siliginis]
MRVRNKPWADTLIADNEKAIVLEPAQYRGHWQDRFASQQPLHVEVGTGKGQFLIGMAKAHPELNFVGIELQKSVLAAALKTSLPEELTNLQWVLADGQGIENFFEPREVAKLYLNFSDPWPKTRHEKRRLTSKTFLASYSAVLGNGGNIQFKTDNRHLFEYSIMSMAAFGLDLRELSLDLHTDVAASEGQLENIETEYEQKFAAKGQPIYRLVARIPEK